MKSSSVNVCFISRSESCSLLRLLHQGEDVAHAEDAGGEAIGMENLERADALAGAEEEDRYAGDRPDGQGRSTPSVAVHLRQDHPVDLQLFVEDLRHLDRVLSRHPIDHQEDLVRLHPLLHPRQLVHQRLIDMEPARGVEQQVVGPDPLGRLEPALRDPDRVGLPFLHVQPEIRLLGKSGKLVHGGGPVDVARGQHRDLLPLAEVEAELGHEGRLARALEADHHDAGRDLPGFDHALGRVPEDLDQHVMDDLDDLLSGGEAAEDLLPERLLLHLADEFLRHGEVDVRFQEGAPDLPERIAHVLLGQASLAAQLLEDGLELFG
jgi:hypothetical protein